MKKTFKKGGTTIEVSISAQAYLPTQEDGTYFLDSIRNLPLHRLYSISANVNGKIVLFSITNLRDLSLWEALRIVEETVSAYLNLIEELPESTVEGKLKNIGYA